MTPLFVVGPELRLAENISKTLCVIYGLFLILGIQKLELIWNIIENDCLFLRYCCIIFLLEKLVSSTCFGFYFIIRFFEFLRLSKTRKKWSRIEQVDCSGLKEWQIKDPNFHCQVNSLIIPKYWSKLWSKILVQEKFYF